MRQKHMPVCHEPCTCLASCDELAYCFSSWKSSAKTGCRPSRAMSRPFVTTAGFPAPSPSPLLETTRMHELVTAPYISHIRQSLALA